MMYYLKLGFILLIICAIAAGLLAYINSLTEPIIATRKAAEEIKTREALIPGAIFEKKEGADAFVYFIAKNAESGELMGYTFIAAKSAYSSTVLTMVGVDKDYKVIAIKVIDQNETPGLGANCLSEDFASMFKGLSETDLLVDKDGGKVRSMAGATITTRAVTNSIREQIIQLRKVIESASADKAPIPVSSYKQVDNPENGRNA